jgi:hypothetical protein
MLMPIGAAIVAFVKFLLPGVLIFACICGFVSLIMLCEASTMIRDLAFEIYLLAIVVGVTYVVVDWIIPLSWCW